MEGLQFQELIRLRMKFENNEVGVKTIKIYYLLFQKANSTNFTSNSITIEPKFVPGQNEPSYMPLFNRCD
jgi:hypothetical protein